MRTLLASLALALLAGCSASPTDAHDAPDSGSCVPAGTYALTLHLAGDPYADAGGCAGPQSLPAGQLTVGEATAAVNVGSFYASCSLSPLSTSTEYDCPIDGGTDDAIVLGCDGAADVYGLLGCHYTGTWR